MVPSGVVSIYYALKMQRIIEEDCQGPWNSLFSNTLGSYNLNQMLMKFCFVIMVYGNKATSFHCSCKMCFSGQSWFCKGKFFFLSLWSLNYTKNFLKIAICSWFEKNPGSLCACGGKQ